MLQDRYTWKAFFPDGREVTSGSDISGAVMVSLIPTDTTLPQHDIAGVQFVRRFSRGFIKAFGGGLREYVHCIVCKDFRVYLRSSNGVVLVTPPDYELYL